MRVVIDTNVLISGILKQHGAEATVLNLVAAKTLTWCVSQPILDEYRVTLTRTKFDFTPAIVALWMDMAAVGHVVKPTSTITESKDERDNRFLECAEAAGADYLVTGNKKHFPPRWKKTVILNAREFLNRL